jgi:integrase
VAIRPHFVKIPRSRGQHDYAATRALPRGTLRRKTARGNRRQPYTRQEAHALIHDARIPVDARAWIALAFFTGMREGEICGRRWRDWDRDVPTLGLLRVHSQYEDQPLKTDDGDDTRPRMVPVHPELAEILQAWWSEGFALVHCRAPTTDDWIVPTRDGGNHTKSSGYKLFQRALAAVGVDNRSLHSTRHTFISVARSNGARPDVLERVTHNSSGEVIDTYTTFEWRPLCDAVARFDLNVDPEANRAVFSAPEPGLEPGTRRLTASLGTCRAAPEISPSRINTAILGSFVC